MDFFYDLYQNAEIAQAKAAAGRADARIGNVQDEIWRLGRRLDALALASQAMWELLREKTGLDDHDIRARMLEIDARDGQVDGKMGAGADACPSCSRPFNKKHNKCLYCGYEGSAGGEHVFGD